MEFKKIHAQFPEERDKPCDHELMRYQGRVPCTGPKVCLMCGYTEDRTAFPALDSLVVRDW